MRSFTAWWVVGILLCGVWGGARYAQPGPWDVEIMSLSVSVSGERRPVTVTLAVPSGRAPLGGELVVFTHGFLLKGDDYLSYGVRLSSHGFSVALPSLPMRPLRADHRQLAGQLQAVIEHLQAEASEGMLRGVVDASRVGLVGHSLGGKLSFFVAGRVPGVQAVAALDPVDGGGPGAEDEERFPRVVPDRMGELRVPILLLGADRAGEALLGQPCAPEDVNYRRFFEAAAGPALEVIQVETGHMQYLDDPNCGIPCAVCVRGSTPSDQVRSTAQAYLAAFFAAYVAGIESAAVWLDMQLAADEADGRVKVRRR